MKKTLLFLIFMFVLAINSDAHKRIHNDIIYKISNNQLEVIGVTNKNISNVVFPNTIDNYTICKIKEKAFSGCRNLTFIDMSKTEIQEIGINAFSYCSNLKNIIFSPELLKIDIGAFYKCTLLTSSAILP